MANNDYADLNLSSYDIQATPDNKDAELQVLYQDGDWYQILYMGRVAWIHGSYIEMIDAPTNAESAESQTTNSDTSTSFVEMGDTPTNIRTLPSTEGEIIHTAQPGERFES